MVQVAHVLSNREKDSSIERFIPMERFEWYAWECKRRMVQDEHSHLAGKPFFPLNQIRMAAKHITKGWFGTQLPKQSAVICHMGQCGTSSEVYVNF